MAASPPIASQTATTRFSDEEVIPSHVGFGPDFYRDLECWEPTRRANFLHGNTNDLIATGQADKLTEVFDYGRASRIILNGVSVARRNCLKPASVATWRNRRSPACAPSPSATSCESDAGVQMKVEAP